MRICFIAYFDDIPGKGDIGTKTVAKHLADGISKNHDVMKLDVRGILSWKKIKTFKPEILHFILAPTTPGFIAAKVISQYYSGAKVVMSAPNPTLSCHWLIKHLKPDIILTQSEESERVFEELDFKTAFLPNGVDTERFKPRSQEERELLKVKYGLETSKIIVLHAGPVIRKRNLEVLAQMQDKKTQVLIIGRKPFDRKLCSELKEKGVTVIMDYVDKMEEIYAFSDCYIFPTSPNNRGASIEMPLSVLEAMATNLPLVSTKFGGLPMIFKEGNGLFFVEDGEDIYKVVEDIENGGVVIKTREKVLPYAWENIAKRLEGIYDELLR